MLEAHFDRRKSLQVNAWLHSLPRCVGWFKALKETNLDLLQFEEFRQLISTGQKHFSSSLESVYERPSFLSLVLRSSVISSKSSSSAFLPA